METLDTYDAMLYIYSDLITDLPTLAITRGSATQTWGAELSQTQVKLIVLTNRLAPSS